MEVMNDSRFEQTNVLIGSTGKTQNFGVSDDPMLMSMLSTGLYANPLRTMLQEIIFNAWDAHRMGNCQDRPIDVYIDDTSGLIVRDYGPGIHPDDMHAVYCIYGNSTKRNDQGQTGGFGLGSKSPFAYTDSFMVANHHGGKKSMYVVNRACDENNGGPGMTSIMENIDTDQSGLIVTVPFKIERDRVKAYEYIKDILDYSGIKINIHFENNPVETIEAESLNPGQYVTNNELGRGTIYAIYGGVRYLIPEHDSYKEEYTFLKKLTHTIGNLFIGFKPDSLTPLPNREGLNMSDKTVEMIKSQLETIEEAFMKVCKPACQAAMEGTMQILKETGIQPQFLAYRWMRAGNRINFNNMVENSTTLKTKTSQRPEGVGENLWTSMVMMAFRNTTNMQTLIGETAFNKMSGIVFVKAFPEWRKHLNYLSSGATNNNQSRYDNIEQYCFPQFAQEMHKVVNILSKATDQNLNLRMNLGNNNQWTKVSHVRGGGKTVKHSDIGYRAAEKIKEQLSKGTHKTPETIYSNRLWSCSTGKEVSVQMVNGVIILAKTATALNETKFQVQKYFAPNLENTNKSYNDPYHSTNFYYSDRVNPLPAIVVHTRKGGYDMALQILEKLGYTVIEADEPVSKIKKTPVVSKDLIGPVMPNAPKKKEKPTFPKLALKKSDWDSEERISDPETYFCCTISSIHGYSSYDKPSISLLQQVEKRWPRTVILHNRKRESILRKKNVPILAAKIHEEVEKILLDEDRLKKMCLYEYAIKNSELPKKLMEMTEIQKLLKIPYPETKDKEQFELDWKLLVHTSENYSDHVFRKTKTAITQAIKNIKNDEDSFSLVREMCTKTKCFSPYGLEKLLVLKNPKEKELFAKKVAQFLQTI